MKFSSYLLDLEQLQTELIVIPYRNDVPNLAFEAMDKIVLGALSERMKLENFRGQKDRTIIWEGLHNNLPYRVIIVGIDSGQDPAAVRWGIGRAVRFATAHSLKSITCVLDAQDFERLERETLLFAEGTVLSNYQFDKYKTKAKKTPNTFHLTFTAVGNTDDGFPTLKKIKQQAAAGRIRAEAVNLARDLVNEPANVLSPAELANRASALSEKHGLECTVLSEKEIKIAGMGLVTAVSSGSELPPRFIHMVYKPKTKSEISVALVGKGITFDSGGLCIKPGKSMAEMKTDMAGAAAVMGIMSVLKQLDISAEVHGIIPAVENAVGAKAARPGDVYRSQSGKTVEVVNTDAEGRLILADAITYACRLNPNIIIDIATLTGSCEIALGSECAGLFAARDEDAVAFENAAKSSGEAIWRLPLLANLESSIKSDVADLKNVGDRFGGAITAALFLKQFTENRAWIHLDIAGPARQDKSTPTCQKGASGFGVLAGLTYLQNLNRQQS